MTIAPHNKEISGFLNESSIFQDIERLAYVGGTSECYKVRIGGEYFFMKRLLPEYANDPKFRLIIEKEYKVGSQIESSHITKYISINNSDECPYILTEYINGTTIEEILSSTPHYFHNRRNLYKFMSQLLEGVQAMHSKRIVHLDLTPQNIMLTKIGNDVKIVDLGFCVNDSYLHTAGTTTAFAAPELKEHRFNDIDEQTDIYAIGTLLQYIERRSGKRLPLTLQKIKRKCLQQEKEKRYADASEIISVIKHRNGRRLLKLAAVLAITAVAFALCVANGLDTRLNDHIAWKRGTVPHRFESGGIFYHITDEDARTVEVTFKGNHPDEFEYEYKGGEIIVPQTVTYRGRTFRVTAFAGQAFKNEYISKINIPDGITHIADSAFIYCNQNGVITIPRSVEHIGVSVFFPMLYIDGIVVDAGNKFYDSRGGCNAIIETATNTLLAGCNSTVIPDGVTSIALDAFVGAKDLRHVTLPATLREIGEAAFVHSGIREIEIPEGVTRLNRYTFQYCENLQSITLPQSLAVIGHAALSHCAFKELEIPGNVTTIEDYAFDWNGYLEKAVIGSGVRSIGYGAFENCGKLKCVVSHIPADSLPSLDNSTFNNIHKDCILYVPRGAGKTYKNSFGWNRFAKIVEME